MLSEVDEGCWWQRGFPAIPAKERGKASLFLCCAKATLLLAPKGGEPRSPPLESPIATCKAGIAGDFHLADGPPKKLLLFHAQATGPGCQHDGYVIHNRIRQTIKTTNQLLIRGVIQ